MSLVQAASEWPQDFLELAGRFPDFPLAEVWPDEAIVQEVLAQKSDAIGRNRMESDEPHQ